MKTGPRICLIDDDVFVRDALSLGLRDSGFEVLTAPGAAAEAALRALDAPTAPSGRETVLVVEDDPFVRGHVTTSLESLGYRVMLAADGREALTMLRGGARRSCSPTSSYPAA